MDINSLNAALNDLGAKINDLIAQLAAMVPDPNAPAPGLDLSDQVAQVNTFTKALADLIAEFLAKTPTKAA